MGIEFTPQQRRVIEIRGRNILVSAAAGSGKTAVLVERIIRMICDEAHPVDIDRLLIVTFTNAAAAEMRERISLGIAGELAARPECAHIQKQATLLHNAQITTIDSFCLFLIRNHFNEIGLDPAFRIADEGESKLLATDVLRELLEDKFAAKEEDFYNCVEYFCPGGREKVLEQHILNLHRFASSQPWPEEWLKDRKQDYKPISTEELEETEESIYLKRHLQQMLQGCAEAYRRLLALCQEPDGPYMYGELVEKELEQLERLARPATLAEYAAWLPAIAFGRLPSKKDESVSPVKRELAKSMRSRIKDTIQELGARFFSTPLPLAAKQAGECARPVGVLIDLALEFGSRLQEKKREKKLLDFFDMEHFALDILLDKEDGEIRPSQVALEYRQYFHEILIDEYQDSNLVQEYLLKALSGEDDGHFNRFMVGDVKQSIYKFRLARPELFLEKYDRYTGEEAEDGPAVEEDSAHGQTASGRSEMCRRIDLSKNFRSRSQVVDTVNGVFSRIMSREIGGIAYDRKAALYAGAVYPVNPGCGSELLLVEKPGSEDGVTAKQAEAQAVALRIRELRRTLRLTDKASGELRPVRYSDIVILLRSNSGWDETFKSTLEEEGIPVHITSKTGYFAAREVQELLQFLRALDNPRQDIPLFGVMRSVFGGFTEEEIALIRSGAGEGEIAPQDYKAQESGNKLTYSESLYEALVRYAGCREGVRAQSESADGVTEDMGEGCFPEERLYAELAEKASRFLECLDNYRALTVYLPIRELLQQIVNDYGYLHYVSALPMGGKRKANVEMLFTKASDFEKTSYFGLFHFIRYIEQLEQYDVDYGEAELLDENADVVRIMSIHKSKGLEFPVTFLSGLSKRFNMQDINQSLIVDMDLGIGTDYVDPGRRIRNKTLRRCVLARKMREDSLAEELRVLYVAMTRPKEKMILTAALDKAEEKWELAKELPCRGLLFHEYMEASSYLDFLLPVIREAAVTVTVTDVRESFGSRVREQVKLSQRRELLRNAAGLADQDKLRELQRRFSFLYPYKALEQLYTKTTVTELKIAAMAQKDEAAFHAFEEQEAVPYIPPFRGKEEQAGGAMRGNAFHKVMELMDFTAVYRGLWRNAPAAREEFLENLDRGRVEENLQAFLDREQAERRLPAEYRDILTIGKLTGFLCSPIALRMWQAQEREELYREQPFVYGICANRLGEQFPEEEKVLIQGIVDVFFVEDGELVLLDYKTDVISSPRELWNRYETQLTYYEEALCRLTGKAMKEKLLYSFYLERCVKEVTT